jgi:hypothetical protein
MPCPHGKPYPSRCKDCGGNKLCEHGRRKCRCRECGGSQICSHDRIRYGCKECRGPAICIHARIKSECRECGGSRFCIHDIRKSYCVECGGTQLCEHGHKKSICRSCKGSAYCEHERIKYRCKDCNGSMICVHNKHKYYCKDCDGRSYCDHGKLKQYCRDCGGSAYCIHDKLKDICKLCGGKNICKHNKHKSYCKECDGSACCKSEWCSTIPSNRKYKGYCLICFIHLFPEEPITRNYKTKERSVTDFIKDTFPDLSWIQDKRVLDGCSARRPDLLCDLGYQVIMIEVDENQHEKYDDICENRRIMELSKDVGHRPIILIRLNPDRFTDISGTSHAGCWAVNKYGTCSIKNRDEWTKRLNMLKDTVNYWLQNLTEKTIENVHLFFNNSNIDTIVHL